MVRVCVDLRTRSSPTAGIFIKEKGICIQTIIENWVLSMLKRFLTNFIYSVTQNTPRIVVHTNCSMKCRTKIMNENWTYPVVGTPWIGERQLLWHWGIKGHHLHGDVLWDPQFGSWSAVMGSEVQQFVGWACLHWKTSQWKPWMNLKKKPKWIGGEDGE